MTYGFDTFPELVGKSLFTDVWSVAMHRHHRLAGEETVEITQLANEVFVTFQPQTDYLLHDQTMQICAEHGFTPRKVTYCWDLASILFNIESDLGVTIVPGPVRDVAGRDLRMIEIAKPDRYIDIMVAWKKNTLNPSIPIFVQKLESLKFLKTLGVRPDDLLNPLFLPPQSGGKYINKAADNTLSAARERNFGFAPSFGGIITPATISTFSFLNWFMIEVKSLISDGNRPGSKTV